MAATKSDQIVINLKVDLTICEGMSGGEKGSNIGKSINVSLKKLCE